MKRSKTEAKRYRPAGSSLQVTEESIAGYIAAIEKSGKSAGTIEEYRRNLHLLYNFLPENKRLRWDTLSRWRASQLDRGYTPRTVNARISAANSYLAFCGRRDLQLARQLRVEKYQMPELSRAEYLRLLQTARLMNRERLYLLIKLFGTTGLPVQGLQQVTVEAVQSGVIRKGSGGKQHEYHLPACLQEELLDYARRHSIRSGQVFLTSAGKPLRRTNVADSIRHLCHDARVPPAKGSPRCLQRMYRSTQERILQNINQLVQQTYNHLLENEQLAVGWTAT